MGFGAPASGATARRGRAAARTSSPGMAHTAGTSTLSSPGWRTAREREPGLSARLHANVRGAFTSTFPHYPPDRAKPDLRGTAPARRKRVSARVLLPGLVHLVVQATRRHHAGGIPGLAMISSSAPHGRHSRPEGTAGRQTGIAPPQVDSGPATWCHLGVTTLLYRGLHSATTCPPRRELTAPLTQWCGVVCGGRWGPPAPNPSGCWRATSMAG